MHKDLAACYENWSTPLEIASLTDMLFSKELFPTEYQNFLKETMLNCQTGTNRLPAPLLDTTARIGHKTGTSDRNVQGELIGINDVGFILLPDGKRYTIAVLVKDSKEVWLILKNHSKYFGNCISSSSFRKEHLQQINLIHIQK